MDHIRKSEYEIVPPDYDVATDTDPVEMTHPKSTVTAELALRAWQDRPRRFVFYHVHRRLLRPNRTSVQYHGYQHPWTKSVTIVQSNGHPMGWYRTVASAWRRLKLNGVGLYLAWLEAEPDGSLITGQRNIADAELKTNEPSTWYLTVPITAYGTEDARARAAKVTRDLETYVPGVDRLDVTIGQAEDPETETHVFCDEPDCVLPHGHTENHKIAADRPVALRTGESTREPNYEDQFWVADSSDPETR